MPLGDFTTKQEILGYFCFCTVKGKGLNTLFPLVKNKTKKYQTQLYTKPETEVLSCQYFSDFFFFFAKLGGFCHVSENLDLQFTAEAEISERVFEKEHKS